jgi:hypothetical protein
MTEQDLDEYAIWSGWVPQSREAIRPELARGVQWLAKMGVTQSPLKNRSPWYSFKVAIAHNLMNQWLLEHRQDRSDKSAEHELRNLNVRLGAGVRPYKA